MWSLVRAEHLKWKHTLGKKLPVIAPVLTALLAFLLTGGVKDAAPAGAWNWWYVMLLPGMLAILCYFSIKKDKKTKYFNILSLPVAKGKSWLGKICYLSFALLAANLVLYAGTLFAGKLLGTTISPWMGFAGAVLLSVTYLWAAPLYLLLSARFGMFAGIFVSMVLSAACVSMLSDTGFWWICPAAIPIRLMCPVLGILPNGLPVPEGSALLQPDVIVPGVLLSIAWFIGLTIVTIRRFNSWEARL